MGPHLALVVSLHRLDECCAIMRFNVSGCIAVINDTRPVIICDLCTRFSLHYASDIPLKSARQMQECDLDAAIDTAVESLHSITSTLESLLVPRSHTPQVVCVKQIHGEHVQQRVHR